MVEINDGNSVVEVVIISLVLGLCGRPGVRFREFLQRV